MNDGKQLRVALELNRESIQAGLEEALLELTVIEERRNELRALISRARAMLGEPDTQSSDRQTLHVAIAQILKRHGNRWMTVSELSDIVNRDRLYEKRDGSPVERSQIHARAKNYKDMFEKDGPKVRLKGP
jgi:hypothetical protein